MKTRTFVVMIFALVLLVSGCGKTDENVAELPEQMFEEGKEIVKLYAKAYNEVEPDENGSKAHDLANEFLLHYENNTDEKNEEYFVNSIKLLQLRYTNFGLAQINESLSDDGGDSIEEKDELKSSLLSFKEEFGIILED